MENSPVKLVAIYLDVASLVFVPVDQNNTTVCVDQLYIIIVWNATNVNLFINTCLNLDEILITCQ